jgi:hypothetical protein
VTVYFLECDGYVKIGYTDAETPDNRVNSMRTGNPHPITVLAYGSGEPSDENELHKMFTEHRKCGEWFHPDEQLIRAMNYVKTMKTTRGLVQYLGLRPSARDPDVCFQKRFLEDMALQTALRYRDPLESWHRLRDFAFESEGLDLEMESFLVTDVNGFDRPTITNRRFIEADVFKTAAARDLANAMLSESRDERMAYWVLAGLADASEVGCSIERREALVELALSAFAENKPKWHHSARDLTLHRHMFLHGARLSAQEFLLRVAQVRTAFLARHWVVVPYWKAPAWFSNYPIQRYSRADGGTYYGASRGAV